MSARRDDGPDDALDPRDRAALAEIVGRPSSEQIERAVEEVEREVALEDLIIVMVEGAAGALGAFLDLIVELASPRDGASAGDAREES